MKPLYLLSGLSSTSISSSVRALRLTFAVHILRRWDDLQSLILTFSPNFVGLASRTSGTLWYSFLASASRVHLLTALPRSLGSSFVRAVPSRLTSTTLLPPSTATA